MEKTRELPLPENVLSKIQEYASDRVGAHQAAQLIHTLDVFRDHRPLHWKIVCCDFEAGDYFIVLRGGETSRVQFRGYDIH